MQRGTLSDLFELLSSMRFAISLLTVLGIASIIGTVIQQGQPYNAYLNQFGPFWFPVLEKTGLYNLYNTTWFVVILAFLVLSTSLCIVRQTAPMLREIRGYREHAREASLRQFAHQHGFHTQITLADAQARTLTYMRTSGFSARSNARADGGVLIAAKQGSASRSGYFLAHGAIVLICIGGLLDGDLPLRVQMALNGKASAAAGQLIAEMPESSRMSEDNWSFRGNLFIPEGRSNRTAVLRLGDGILLQPLPFSVALTKFHIEHYDNGSPSRFASDIVITDDISGETHAHTLEVNRPLTHRGVTLYQSGFEDGGSMLRLTARSLSADDASPITELAGAVGDTLAIETHEQPYKLELTDFRAFNVEDFSSESAGAATATGLARLEQHLGSGATATSRNDLRNLGPSFGYKLRDAAGQAREFQNYMMPVEQRGAWFLISGMRETAGEAFRYIRFPLDDEGRVDTWFDIHQIFMDPKRHAQIAARFAQRSLPEADGATRERLAATAQHTASLFADRGYESVGRFIENTIPAAEQERALGVFSKVLQGLAWEAWLLAREQAGLTAPAMDDRHVQFLGNTLAALSDSRFYGAPLYLQLTDYTLRQATVLQVTRSPGKPLVYLGSLLMVLGIFAMLYIRERRLFVLIKPDGDVLVALSTNRRTMDVDDIFRRHASRVHALLAPTSATTLPERTS
jgi:cytochrome c biogenesis protein